VTALSGQVLRLNGLPLAEVTLQVGARSTRTDRTGRFLLTGIVAGTPVFVINGATANQPGRTGWEISFKDGTAYEFPGAGSAPGPMLTAIRDRQGNRLVIQRDDSRLITRITSPNGRWVAFTYDGLSRATQVTDSGGRTLSYTTVANAYDGLDRVISETTSLGTVTYTYDAAGRRATMAVPSQTSISYGYDNADRLTSITQGTAVVQYAYDNANRRATLTLPNGVVTEYGYDAASQLTGLTYKLGGTTLGGLQYTYDPAGRRGVIGGTWARTGLPAAVASATYNANNQQTAFGGVTLTYDLTGNLTGDGTNTYTWDSRNRLTAVSGPTAASFVYDAVGRRRSKTFAGTTTSVLHDGLNPVQEQTGSATVNLLTGLGIDEFFSRADTNGTMTLLADTLGSAVALTDNAGAVQTSYTYEPFGATAVTGSATPNVWDYTGRESDPTGLKYYRARYYHPGLQRFIAEDPIGFRGGDVNLYAYVGNQPINFRDPLGLSQDNYTPDMHKHGAPHVDRYNPSGQNVGRYRHDGTPIDHMGKPSPGIPNSDAAKFAKAATKLKKLMKAAGLLGIAIDILLYPDEAGAGSECPAGPGTCGQLLPSAPAPAETPQLDCLSGRKGVC